MTRLSRVGISMVLATAITACSTSNTASPDGGGPADGSATDDGSATQTGPQGCAAGPDAGGGYNPPIDPANYVAKVDNPYFPVAPGMVWKYKDSVGSTTEINVYTFPKIVQGVTCLVVRDQVTTSDGMLTEDTWDWYAQDKDGNVWYMGEDTSKYGAGQWSKEGSWTGGADCARPGIIMPAHPKVGDSYRQEFYPGHAEDRADILSLTETITTPYGTMHNCILTRDYSRLAPGADEHKYYCPGVGNAVTQDLPEGVGTREEIQSFTAPGSDGGSTDAQADGPVSTPDAGAESGSSPDASSDATPATSDAGTTSDAPGDAAHD